MLARSSVTRIPPDSLDDDGGSAGESGYCNIRPEALTTQSRKREMSLAEFRQALGSSSVRWPGALDGLYFDSPFFSALVTSVSDYLGTSVYDSAEAELSAPPAIAFANVERSGYAASFPQLLGLVSTRESQQEHPDSVALAPTACYHVYPLFASGALPIGAPIDVENWCFRNEMSRDPFRMVTFRMRENVFVGKPSDVDRWVAEVQGAGTAALARLGLDVSLEAASDPFFGETARLMTASQLNQGLKHEFQIELPETRVALGSTNRHLDHMTHSFGIGAPEDGLHSACIGFGLERVALALLYGHGLGVSDWPPDVRELLDAGALAR